MELNPVMSPKVIKTLDDINTLDLFNPDKTLYITRSYYERTSNWTMVSMGPNVYVNADPIYTNNLQTYMMKFKNFDLFYDYRRVISFHNYTGFKEADQIDENELLTYLISRLKNKVYIVGNCDVLGELYTRLLLYVKYNKIDFDLNSIIFVVSPKIGPLPISKVCKNKLSHNSTTCSICAIYLMSEIVYKESVK